MNLPTIPLATYQAQHPRSQYIREQSEAVDYPRGWFRQLERTNTVAECEAIKAIAEAEIYASQWVLVEAA